MHYYYARELGRKHHDARDKPQSQQQDSIWTTDLEIDSFTPGEPPVEVYNFFSEYMKQVHVLENFIL